MTCTVYKFGGSSLADAARLLRARRDLVLSFGERLSALWMVEALEARGLPAYAVDAREYVLTDERFGEARVDGPATDRAFTRLAVGDGIPVVPGFIGATPDRRTTTLGRDGSDLTATLLARALRAREVVIWSDVPGVMTADPAVDPEAKTLPRLSWRRAAELARAGARVLHPRCVDPLVEPAIPLRIRSALDPDAPGTLVHGAGDVPSRVLNLFVLGAGTVGGALLREISRRRAELIADYDLDRSGIGCRPRLDAPDGRSATRPRSAPPCPSYARCRTSSPRATPCTGSRARSRARSGSSATNSIAGRPWTRRCGRRWPAGTRSRDPRRTCRGRTWRARR